ncbi:type IVa pilus pseudopilin TppF [Simiduia litorea]|uniref:type II secretion system protein n=1 Tax=Simiduia litorea TaxID=1435348 RepID=UPI0036F1B369
MTPDPKAKHEKGFTLVELVAVVVILGVLAALAIPRFVDFADAAQDARINGIAGSYKAGVDQVHAYWLAKGSPGPSLNMITLPIAQAGGDLSVNAFGWPADTRGVSLTLNSTNDCLDVWRAVLEVGAPTVSATADADFTALYIGGNSCRYNDSGNTAKSIQFDSNSGQVTVNL